MNLPEKFIDRMKNLLDKNEYESFIATYNDSRYYGLRINELKVKSKDFPNIVDYSLLGIPWCQQGYYYQRDDKPSKHPYYYAGLYYIQEPSAMAPAALIPIEDGDKVLDICAAPGGKSTQIASRLNNTGILISNDISTTRARALLKNIENSGARNVIITNETPERLASKLPSYFDKILIDAPCSGEGMFRLSEDAAKSWDSYGIDHFCNLQSEILKSCTKMLRPGGMIVYSTCTFSPEENEGMISKFLNENKDFDIVAIDHKGGLDKGRPKWCDGPEKLEGAARLWPHKLKGEGHFVCILQKSTESECMAFDNYLAPKKSIKDYEYAKEFFQKYTYIDVDQKVMVIDDKMYLVPNGAPDLDKLRVIRSGMLLGVLKNKRFEPSTALALGYKKEMFTQVVDFKLEDENVWRYLKGETIIKQATKGYNLICVDGYPLGWAKGQNNMLKNEYPPSWRAIG